MTRRAIGIAALLAMATMIIVSWPSQYQLETVLYRVNADDTRTALVNGATVSVGDHLVLDVSATIPLYVYVFNEDSVGNGWGLFPLASLGHENPLLGGAVHTLPALEDRELTWMVDSANIVKRIHILAYPERDERVETSFAALPEAQLAATGFEPRGVGRLSVHEAVPKVSAAAIIQLSRELTDDTEMRSGTWYRVIELDDPK